MKSFAFAAIAMACLAGISAQNCKPGEQLCGDSMECVNETLWCDGYLDCANDADENDCPCDAGEWKCPNSDRCISESWICDGEADCPGGEDENPEGGCPPCNGFECVSDGKCIPNSWVCDDYRDCADGSDEVDCSTECNGFRCDTGECISSSWQCDNDLDCPGGEDEKDCACDGFKCASYQCIPASAQCDGKQDCRDGDDELNCRCDPPKHSCDGGKRCIPEEWKCDKVDDCEDKSDEANCASHRIPLDAAFVAKKRKHAEDAKKPSAVALRDAEKQFLKRQAHKKMIRTCMRTPFFYAKKY